MITESFAKPEHLTGDALRKLMVEGAYALKDFIPKPLMSMVHRIEEYAHLEKLHDVIKETGKQEKDAIKKEAIKKILLEPIQFELEKIPSYDAKKRIDLIQHYKSLHKVYSKITLANFIRHIANSLIKGL